MTDTSQREGLLQQLLELHAVDQQILEAERELHRSEEQLGSTEDSLAGLTAKLERVSSELERRRGEARSSEGAADAKRDTLYRIRNRVDRSQNERQYSAASLEFDLVKQDLRSLEDRALEKLQLVEDLEARQKDLTAQLQEANSAAGPQREETEKRREEVERELAIERDRRNNLAVRLESGALGLYDRIRAGRSEVALAPLTAETVCGHCFTAVTIQQEMEIKSLAALVCCEGCGVILYPEPSTG